MKHLRPHQHSHGIGPLFDGITYGTGKTGFVDYPDAPGYKRVGTSKDAAEEMKEESSTLRQICLNVLSGNPSTADEIADMLGRTVLAIRPRFSELVRQGKIIETGERRRNASGKFASVWRVA